MERVALLSEEPQVGAAVLGLPSRPPATGVRPGARSGRSRRSSPTPWAAWSGRTSSRHCGRRPATSRARPRGSASPATPCATAWRSTVSGGRSRPAGPRRGGRGPGPSRIVADGAPAAAREPRPDSRSVGRSRGAPGGPLGGSQARVPPKRPRPAGGGRSRRSARAARSRSWSRRSRRSADGSRR